MDTFNSTEVPDNRMSTLDEMERQYENRNENYFILLLNHRDMVIRTRAVCILADISTESVVKEINTRFSELMGSRWSDMKQRSHWDNLVFRVQSKPLPTQ